jgi:hypothetical protein
MSRSGYNLIDKANLQLHNHIFISDLEFGESHLEFDRDKVFHTINKKSRLYSRQN